MANYIDLVLVKHQEDSEQYWLFQAPRWSHLAEGTEVLCDTKIGKTRGFVVASCTVEPDSAECEMMKLACGATELRKILGTIKFKELDYSDD